MISVTPEAAANANRTFVPLILAVDDEDSVRTSLKYILKDKYPDVMFCANSTEAMEVMRSRTVHVVLLDIKMVGESGLDLLTLMKAHDPFVEVIMLTAFETQANIKEALRRGASEFLHKPPQMHTLLDAVAKAVDARRATERMKEAIVRASSLENDLFLMQCGIIHDLRNQITVISGMLSLMDARVSDHVTLDAADVSGLRNELLTAQRGANTCISMTARQMDLVRSVSRSAGARFSSLYEATKDIADSLLFHPDARGCTIKVVPPSAPLPTAEIPGTTAFQMALNLVLNAAQARKPASFQHEITVTFVVEDKPVNLALCVDNASSRWIGLKTFKNRPPFIRMSIQDTGTGIKPEILGRMFAQSYTTKRAGTGVGLMLVGKHCTDNQLLLSISTQVNVGTTISIYFPAVSEPPETLQR